MDNWIIEVITTFGYLGIFLLMLLENLFPPIPSEVIMPVAGLAVAAGKLSFTFVIIVALIGTLLGNLVWYGLARMLGRERFTALAIRWGKYFAVKPTDITTAIDWFDRHGTKAVLIGRFAPGVRTLISVPAGLAEMPLGKFLILSTIGSTIWIALLISAGMLLHNNWHIIGSILDPLGKILIVAIGLGLIGWVARRRWNDRQRSKNAVIDPAAE